MARNLKLLIKITGAPVITARPSYRLSVFSQLSVVLGKQSLARKVDLAVGLYVDDPYQYLIAQGYNILNALYTPVGQL